METCGVSPCTCSAGMPSCSEPSQPHYRVCQGCMYSCEHACRPNCGVPTSLLPQVELKLRSSPEEHQTPDNLATIDYPHNPAGDNVWADAHMRCYSCGPPVTMCRGTLASNIAWKRITPSSVLRNHVAARSDSGCESDRAHAACVLLGRADATCCE